MTAPRDPVRLLTLTTLFPSSVRPRHGIFVANRLRRLCATGRVSARVIAAVPSFPGWYRDDVRVPEAETIDGLAVRHPRYLNIPRVGMRLQPRLLASALLRDLERSGWRHDGFDVVDAHYFYPDGVAAAAVADALDLPLVISARGSDVNLIGTLPGPRRAMVAGARRAQATIAVSQALAEAMIALGMPGERTSVLRNGVDAGLFQPAPRNAARERLSLPLSVPLLLGVGNQVAEKGFDLLLRVASAVPEAHVLLVGEGTLRASLEALARERLPGRCHWRASMAQAELRYAYSAADVLVLPSLREGWPNVLLEAMACGTPVCAADVGGVREIVRDRAAGCVVPGRDETVWRDALVALLHDRAPPERVRTCALPFGWDEVVNAQCDLYERVRTQWTGRRRVAGQSQHALSEANP